jgi:uncharacterized protein (AIM24 family)
MTTEVKYAPLSQDGSLQLTGPTVMDARPMLNGFIRDRPAFAHVEVGLAQGQKVMADGKAMIWMDGHVPIETKCGSCGAACWRGCAGESCCQNFYTGPGRVTFGFDLPGDMLPFGVTPGAGWILAAGAFVCGTDNITVTARFSGCFACCCGGTNVFLVKITVQGDQNGMFYAGGYGAITRHDVPADKFLWLSRGLFFAASDKTQINGGLPGSCVSCLYGGQGFAMKFQGPAVVYSQNRNPDIWYNVLHPPPPRKKKGGQPGALGGAVGAAQSQ